MFFWSAALEDLYRPHADTPIDRWLAKVDRRLRKVLPLEPIATPEPELAEAFLSATGQHQASSTRLTDDALSVSYKARARGFNVAYVVHLRHHSNAASMDSLMLLISQTIDSNVLPVPPVYPIPGEKTRQQATDFERQITQLIPGIMASKTYPHLPHDKKPLLVQKVALAFQACWSIPLPTPRLIGEVITCKSCDSIFLDVAPDRHHGLGGPFFSVSNEYLQEYIESSLAALEKQESIKEYKEEIFELIRDFIKTRMNMNMIPAIVEDDPVVAIHSDMGPHNIIVSSQTQINIQSFIDWELVASAPFMSPYRIIEMFSRPPAVNGFGPEYDRAVELRMAFLEAIPQWKSLFEAESTKIFLEWFIFGLLLKPEWRSQGLSDKEAREYWQENIQAV
jgi:hypothetical protein